jgi:hypothetical protein
LGAAIQMKRHLGMICGMTLICNLWVSGCSPVRHYLAASYGIGVSEDRWAGVYQLPNENQVGTVIMDFNKFVDSIESVCWFKNETFNFEGTGELKGEVKDDIVSMAGVINDPAQGKTPISIRSRIHDDVMEGDFSQQVLGKIFSGAFLLVRLTHTTYLGGIKRHEIRDGGRTLIDLGVSSQGLLGPGRADAYGPGIHSDATGRPFTWRTNEGRVTFGPVKENAYGIGIGMDQFGRPVRAKRLW